MWVIALLICVRWNILVSLKFISEFWFTFWNRTPVCLFGSNLSFFSYTFWNSDPSSSSSSSSIWFVHPLYWLLFPSVFYGCALHFHRLYYKMAGRSVWLFALVQILLLFKMLWQSTVWLSLVLKVGKKQKCILRCKCILLLYG